MDYHNQLDGTDKNIIIYGHNTQDGSMFGSLRNTLKREWYENNDNQIIKLYTKDQAFQYQIFSIYNIDNEQYYLKTSFDNNFTDFANKLKDRSIYNFGIDVKENDSILTLSTCSHNGKKRVVIHAKRIN